MGGEWLPPGEEPEHTCDLPDTWWHGVGERWRCECGATYVIEAVPQHGEQWNQFRRIK